MPIHMQDSTSLIDAIDGFLAKAAMSPFTFGRKALGDPHFVGQLRKGRRVWPETEAKVRHFMATYTSANRTEARAA
jgi:hypothetical protein